MTTALPGLFTRPYITISNQFGVPILTDSDGNGVPSIKLIPLAVISYVIILDALAREYKLGRKYRDDQRSIYRSLEEQIDTTFGLDGRACLLRFICDLQKYPIREWTIVGELITSVFTPLDDEHDTMEDYRGAQMAGLLEEPESCLINYGNKCPFSVFNYFRDLDDLEKNDLDLESGEEVQDNQNLEGVAVPQEDLVLEGVDVPQDDLVLEGAPLTQDDLVLEGAPLTQDDLVLEGVNVPQKDGHMSTPNNQVLQAGQSDNSKPE
ncbi:uncharacterized protein [Procambarus clarkii]|uniref:uncharacterized protein n=1 Tax=Procambarus clarkii TaxID=6728 RepID=UPI0037429967